MPIALTLMALAPAVIVLGVRALFSGRTAFDLTKALPFANYGAIIGVVILLFSAVTTPELLCPDRRDGTLQLYFATAVSRREYLAGRLMAAVGPLLLVTLVPLLVLFFGIMVFEQHPVGYLQREWAQLPRIVVAGVLMALYYALVGLAVSSLTGRRAFAIGGYVLLLVAPTIIAGLIREAGGGDGVLVIQLSVLPIKLQAKLFGAHDIPGSAASLTIAYIAVVAVATAVLLRRYARSADT